MLVILMLVEKIKTSKKKKDLDSKTHFFHSLRENSLKMFQFGTPIQKDNL
jgi:hypothetical protein